MPKVPYPYEVNGKLVTGNCSLIPICSLSNRCLLPSLTALSLVNQKNTQSKIQVLKFQTLKVKINAPSYQRSKTFSSRANIFLAKLSIQKSFLVWSRSFGIKWNYFGPILGQDIEVLKTWWKWNNETEFKIKRGLTKGQLISEWLFDVLNFSKNTHKNLVNFCSRI